MTVDALGVAVAGGGLDLSAFPQTSRPAEVSLGEHDPVSALGRFTSAVLDRTTLVCVHAGVVHAGAGAVAFAGRSGIGKSTLTAALVAAGFGYLSDEVLALDSGGMTHSFPRPISVDQHSLRLLGRGPSLGPLSDEVLLPLPGAYARGPSVSKLATVLLLERATTGPGSNYPPNGTTIEPASRRDAVASLIQNSFNHWRDPQLSLRTFVRAVRDAAVFRIRYSDAPALAAELRVRLPTSHEFSS